MIFLKDTKQGAKILQSGGLVVYPTETLYALGADPFQILAIEKIYELKKREQSRPLPLIADSLQTVTKFFQMSSIDRGLAEKYWPGPLTLVLPIKKDFISCLGGLTLGSNEVAVRVSSNKIAIELANLLQGLVVSTSANISGGKPLLCKKELKTVFAGNLDKLDGFIDGGVLQESLPSTIVKSRKNGLKIIRQGVLFLDNFYE